MLPPSGTLKQKQKIFQLEKVQRRAARWTTSNYDYRSSLTAMLLSLGWRRLEQRQKGRVWPCGSATASLFSTSQNRLSRHCHSMTFTQIHTSKVFHKHLFYPLAIFQWNAWPQHVVWLPTIDSFKEAVGGLRHSRP